jgi:hypothetical protein
MKVLFKLTYLLVAGMTLAACGGGYGGGGGGMSTTPTVTITAPASPETINFGQGVKISWTSSNAVSCNGTTSSNIGGAFSGNLPTAGSMTVAPTAAGSVTYTVTCTAASSGYGSGAQGKGTSPAVTVNPSILSTLATTKITTIGSTIDPIEGGGNPYGLTLAMATSGLITKGDLIICNFNDGKSNTQGLGTTVVGLHPTAAANPGLKPYRIAQSDLSLKGCNALAALPDGSVAAAAWTANANPLVSSAGAVTNPYSLGAGGFGQPWGQVYVPASGQRTAALYLATFAGTIARIALTNDAQTSATEIVKGFCASGAPGAIFAPAGLTYDASLDTLYVVDTSSNSVVALANVSGIGKDGVVVSGQCGSPPTPAPTFSGPSASSARVIAHGGGLIAPISSALLSDGNLLVSNGDINIAGAQMPNLLFEISPVLPGGFVGQPIQLDNGAPGALFGLVATVDGQGNPLVYFNDDNNNTVMLITK